MRGPRLSLTAVAWLVAAGAIAFGLWAHHRGVRREQRPLTFTWGNVRGQGVLRDLAQVAEQVGRPIGLTEAEQADLTLWDSDRPVTYAELTRLLSWWRRLSLRASQMAGRGRGALAAASAPTRLEQSVHRRLDAASEEWTLELPAGDVRFERFALANTGDRPATDVHVRVSGHPDWRTIDALLGDALGDARTARDKAMALFRFFERHCGHHSASRSAEMLDPVKLFNVWGYGICGQVSRAYATMARRAGLRARAWNLVDHGLAEVWFDGGWRLLDVDVGVVFPLAEGGALASLEQLGAADPDVIRRAYRTRVRPDVVEVYVAALQGRTRRAEFPLPDPHAQTFHQIRVDLMPGERVTWDRRRPDWFYTSYMWGAPPTGASIRYDWLVTASASALSACLLDGATVHESRRGASLTLRSGGWIEIPLPTCHPLVDGRLECSAAGAQDLSVSVKPGQRDWRRLTRRALAPEGDRLVCDLQPLLANADREPDYGAVVRLSASADVQLTHVRLVLVGQLAAPALPILRPGANRVQWSCGADRPNVDLRLTWSVGGRGESDQ